VAEPPPLGHMGRPATPIWPGGCSATSRPADLGVAEPPASQMGVVSATPILALGGGRTTPMGHGGGQLPPDFFFIIYIYIYIYKRNH